MTDFKAMSDAATQGEWAINNKVGVLFGPDVQIATFGAFLDHDLVPFNGDRWNADARLCAALVNAYRDGTIGDTAAAYERGLREAAGGPAYVATCMDLACKIERGEHRKGEVK